LVDKKASMSIQQQCKLLGVPRSSYYHKPKRRVSRVEELLMQAIDRIYMQEPSYGSRRLRDELAKLGIRPGSFYHCFPLPVVCGSSVRWCISCLSLSGSFLWIQTNFSSGPVYVTSTTSAYGAR
jgi:hypothetical protein